MSDIDTLKNYRIDYLVSGFRAVAGCLPPVIAPIFVELANHIPGQRLDRIVVFLKELCEQVNKLELTVEGTRNLFAQEGAFELCEEACEQATRTTSDERRKCLANIIVHGLYTAEIPHSRLFLRVLQQLIDQEVLVLASFWKPDSIFNKDFIVRHKDIVDPSRAKIPSTSLILMVISNI